MLLIQNIKTPIGADEETAVEKALSMLRLKRSQVKEAYLSKFSLDARDQQDMKMVSTVAVRLRSGEERYKDHKNVQYKPDEVLTIVHGQQRAKTPVVVAGFGPAGIFAASLLAEEGYRVIVLERGYPMDERVQAVENYWQTGRLDPRCNVQFGEGGAGTFSDGKLTTRINDPLCSYVLDRFAEHGAPIETLRKAKPHIGTDKLRGVVKSMREKILSLGGEIRFNACLTGLRIENDRLIGVYVNGEPIETERLILAVGHSARDTFKMLRDAEVPMESKPFSVGVRIEHLQTEINKGLYGKMAGHPALPPGEYQLSHRENGRAVYTFCMCPGGLVVPSASAEGQVVTNGMSEYKRDRENANSALVVSVDSRDFGSDILDGIRFQETLEQNAYRMAGKNYRAPGVTAGNFLEGKTGLDFGRVQPSYALGLEAVDLDRLFPGFVTDMLRTGLVRFDKKLPGFAAPDAVMTGVETRTSSPVRVLRDEDCQSKIRGLYPCGEGAGYAGGIMSAAVDGLRVALSIIRQYAE